MFSLARSGQVSNDAFKNLAHRVEIIPILPEFDRPIRLFDTDKFSYVISQGEKAAEEQMPYLQQLLSASSENAPIN